jgi:hypothetical protein
MPKLSKLAPILRYQLYETEFCPFLNNLLESGLKISKLDIHILKGRLKFNVHDRISSRSGPLKSKIVLAIAVQYVPAATTKTKHVQKSCTNNVGALKAGVTSE